MIVLLDMDDVMANTSTYLLRVLKDKHPENPEFQKPRICFDIKDAYSPEALKLVQAVLYDADFQLSIPPVPGSLETVAEIIGRGHDIFFCSAPHEYYETCVKEKYQWAERMFGRAFVRKVMLTHDKTMIYGDLLIDDKPEIRGLKSPSWERILFTQEYNRYINSGRRLDNWSDWKRIIPELA